MSTPPARPDSTLCAHGRSLVVDARVLRQPLSGVGRYTVGMLRHLGETGSSASPALGIHCLVNTLDMWQQLGPWPDGMRASVIRGDLQSHPKGDLLYQWEARQAVHRNSPCIFWGPAFQMPLSLGSTPSIVTVHDLAAFHHAHTMPAKFAWYMRTMVRLTVRRATRIIAVSAAIRAEILETFSLPPERVVHVGEGPLIAADSSSPVDDAKAAAGELAETGLVDESMGGASQPFFLHVGAFEPRKNIPFLLRAFELARERGAHQRLVLCGPPGWRNESILGALESSPARPFITRLSYVSEPTLRFLYRNTDALLMPSLYEGFGLPPLEAAALGARALVSDRGALPEVAANSSCIIPLDLDAWAECLVHLPAVKSAELRALTQRHVWLESARRFQRVCEEITP